MADYGHGCLLLLNCQFGLLNCRLTIFIVLNLNGRVFGLHPPQPKIKRILLPLSNELRLINNNYFYIVVIALLGEVKGGFLEERFPLFL